MMFRKRAEVQPPADRPSMIAHLHAEREAVEREAVEHAKGIAAAEQRACDRDAQLQAALRDLFNSRRARSASNIARERTIQKLERELEQSADRRIGETIDTLQQQRETLMSAEIPISVEKTYHQIDGWSERTTVPAEWRPEKIVARLDAIRGAIASAKALKLKAIAGDALRARPDELLESAR